MFAERRDSSAKGYSRGLGICFSLLRPRWKFASPQGTTQGAQFPWLSPSPSLRTLGRSAAFDGGRRGHAYLADRRQRRYRTARRVLLADVDDQEHGHDDLVARYV